MAQGRDVSDWNVNRDGDQGVVACAEYAGRFKVKRSGVIQIIWLLDEGPGPEDDGPVGRAAQEAIEAAIRPRA